LYRDLIRFDRKRTGATCPNLMGNFYAFCISHTHFRPAAD
jgi:hypothetical protein